MARPRISQLTTWDKFESKVMHVIMHALQEMIQNKPYNVDTNEDTLNLLLHRYLMTAYHAMRLDRKYAFQSPHFTEANNQPCEDDQARDVRLGKRPDFQWGFLDNYAVNAQSSALYLTLECKRLGSPKNGRDFDILYVQNGVYRFITVQHSYAKNRSSAFMLGYIQDQDGPTIMSDVNRELNSQANALPLLQLSKNGWSNIGIYELEQKLDRSFHISPFRLRHLWVNLA